MVVHFIKFAFTSLLLGACLLANAGIHEAQQFFLSKDYPSALKEYLPLAKSGNALAATRLGIMYTNGYGVPKDFKEAFIWFQKAANQDEPEAQYFMGMFLLNGYGVDKKPEQAIKWFKKYAKQANVQAQSNLGVMYMLGIGTAVDYPSAFIWNLKAAENAHVEAMYNLGQLYEKGLGTSQSLQKAIYWYEKAANQGHNLSEFELGVAHANGLGDYKKDESKAIAWYQKAANNGNVAAQFNLASIYYEQSSQDPKKLNESISWFTKAAEQGEFKSQFRLADFYLDGLGVPKNTAAGIEWLTKSAEQGFGLAQKKLGLIYLDNKSPMIVNGKLFKKGGLKSKELSDYWLNQAVATWEKHVPKDDKLAIDELAFAYQLGLGVSKNYVAAAELYLKSMALDKPSESGYSQQNLNAIYRDGNNQQLDALEAKALIDKMAEANNLTAVRFLARHYSTYSNNADGNLKLARYWYDKLALTGDRGAQLALARLYMSLGPDESGTKPDYVKAQYWFKKVAGDDKPNAQYELAKLYISGQGGEKDSAQAMTLLNKAADHNVLDAQIDLAHAYKDGIITTQNYQKALQLMQATAIRIYPGAGGRNEDFSELAGEIGAMFQNGVGAAVDKIEAYVWYALAINTSHLTISLNTENIPFLVGALSSDQSSGLFRLEADAPTSRLVIEAVATEALKAKNDLRTSKLHALESNMTKEELTAAKKALQDWINLRSSQESV